ncbi:MAG TPA: hypothetical protein VN213_02380 [Solirubrobacteraceae bacterium]|nr:hypothetical protein [Solirubrobacteraceae bacterium]
MPTRAEVEGLRERRRIAVEQAERNRAMMAELRRDVTRALDEAQARRRREARVALEPSYRWDHRSARSSSDARSL